MTIVINVSRFAGCCAMPCQCCCESQLQHLTGSCCQAGWVLWRYPATPSTRILHVHLYYQASQQLIKLLFPLF
jgi:hypothetical protein